MGLERRDIFQRSLRTRIDKAGDCLYVEKRRRMKNQGWFLSGLSSCVNSDTLDWDVTQEEVQIWAEIFCDFGPVEFEK